MTGYQQAKKVLRESWYWVCLGVTVALMIPLIGGFIFFSGQEQSHYHETVCKISGCMITYATMCTVRQTEFACYSGSYVYSVEVNNVSYPKVCTFSAYDDDNYQTYLLCLSNGTVWCAYDDRDIEGTTTQDYNPVWRNLLLVPVAGCCIIVVAVGFALFTHFRARKLRARQQNLGTVENRQ